MSWRYGIPNAPLIIEVFSSVEISLLGAFLLLINLLGSVSTNFTTLSVGLLSITAMLTGVYVALLCYHIKHRLSGSLGRGAGIVGIVSGLIGVGCVACGSLLITSLFSFGVAVTLLGVLPLGGMEFSLVGIALLLISIVVITREIEKPNVCS